jgi:membrane-bound lytic murein transglycosylase B
MNHSAHARRGLGALTAVLVVLGLALGGAAIGGAVAGEGAGDPVPAAAPSAAPTPRPTPAPAASPTAAPTGGTIGVLDLADPAWLARVGSQSQIPAPALAAYAGAALQVGREQPGCHLGWNTLAAIGLVESAHGTAGGSALGAGGTAVPPIVGPVLDGRPGRAQVADSDGGLLDGDTGGDRAVGPMQFLPQTWATWAADGDGDGVPDPQDVADAALAAARYLCSAGDLSDPDTWIAAIDGYNRGADYNEAIAAAADRYAALNG